MNRTMMMLQFTQLFQGLFAYSPRSSLSFNNSCRKMMAEGNITPASTCTPKMMSCKHAERSDYDSKIQNRSRRGCLVGQPSEYSRGDHGTSLENRRREKEGPPQDRHHAVAHGGPGGGSGHRQPQRTSVPNLYQDGAARGSAKGAPVRLIAVVAAASYGPIQSHA